MNPKNTKLNDIFFNHPEWANVEAMIMKHVDTLKDLSTIDTKESAEHVKAETIGRMRAYEILTTFLNETRFVSKPLTEKQHTFQ